MTDRVGSGLHASGSAQHWLLERLPLIVTVVASVGLLAYGPIGQLENYHAFADQRVALGIPHAGDVVSNVGFAIVGVWGLQRLWSLRLRPAMAAGLAGYALFCLSLVLTSAGSTFYHLAPDNTRLVWDRLPIALACAGLLAAVRAESRTGANGALTTAVLALAAIASVLWWSITDRTGAGDLRPYLLLQLLPLVLIPLWQWTSGAAKADRMAFGLAILLYILAKAAELADHALYSALGSISGHTLKHLLATAAAAVLVRRFGTTTGA